MSQLANEKESGGDDFPLSIAQEGKMAVNDKRMTLKEAVSKFVQNGDTVFIGDYELEWQD